MRQHSLLSGQLRFNPTMVRLLLFAILKALDRKLGFNPTMVRLLLTFLSFMP